jgi:hypothetical protein
MPGMTERVTDSIDRTQIILGKKPTGNGELFWRGSLKKFAAGDLARQAKR